MKCRLLVVLFFASSLFSQAPPQGDSCHSEAPVGWVPRELLERPIGLREGIGTLGEEVTTTSPEAQRFYDQGLRYLHSYVWVEAARSFHQALRHDPKLAMAYVGLSRAYSGFSDTDAAAAMVARAVALREGASEREKTHIDLRALRVEAIRDFKSEEKLAAYKSKLDAALARHFDDPELWLLRGSVEDRFGASGIGQYGSAASIPYYEHVLAGNPSHFAADHYLVHSYEVAGRIEDALEHGAKYAAAAPAVPHAHHMFGHDLRRVGRTREAIDRFETADRLELAYFEREKVKPEMDWHHPHNLDLLATSFQHQGQMRKAEELMRRSYAILPVTEIRAMNKKEWPAFLLARNRVNEAAAPAAAMMKSDYPGARALGHIFAGQIALRAGKLDQARQHLETATAESTKSEGVWAEIVRGSLQPYLNKLRGAILIRSGDREKGSELLRSVQLSLRAIPGPDAWMQALFELESIARIAREAGDGELVEFTARQMLEHDAAYGGTHYVLGLIAERHGKHREAEEHFAEARRHWAFADADLPELKRVATRHAATR